MTQDEMFEEWLKNYNGEDKLLSEIVRATWLASAANERKRVVEKALEILTDNGKHGIYCEAAIKKLADSEGA
jgi:hypothetical protein